MQFRTKVEIPNYPFGIGYENPGLCIGSCFASVVGNMMSELRFPVSVNPFGPLYNPLSIYNGLEILSYGKTITENDLFRYGELWHSFAFHGSFSSVDLESALKRMNESVSKASEIVAKSEFIFITFGTSHYFTHKKSGIVAGNCHKLPSTEFNRNILSVSDTVNIHNEFSKSLRTVNQRAKMIFTVSPVRHLKNGAHGNNLDKATLALAVDQIIKSDPDNCFYFPAYEILIDELRDYRFYADDMCHPSGSAVEYIREIFGKSFFDPAASGIIKEVEYLNTAKKHKPLNPDSESYRKFVTRLESKEQKLFSEYPFLNG